MQRASEGFASSYTAHFYENLSPFIRVLLQSHSAGRKISIKEHVCAPVGSKKQLIEMHVI